MSPKLGARTTRKPESSSAHARVLARGAAAEVAAGDEDRRALVLRPAQLEVGILHPVEEEELAVARALDPLQELLRDDLVGVDVGAVEHRGAAGDLA